MAARRITFLFLFIIIGGFSPLSAESTRSLIREGNEAFERGDFVEAEIEYRKALENDDDLVEGKYNLGGALYKQGKFDGSMQSLDETLDMTTDDEMAARAYFNRGNALFKQQMYRESIDSYIRSLRLDPNDMDAKHNLLYAMKKLREQQQSREQPSDERRKSDEEDRRNQEKQSGSQERQEPEKDKRSSGPEEKEKREEDRAGESKTEAEERQISRAEAERILQALKENEREIQKRLRANPAGRVRVEKDW